MIVCEGTVYTKSLKHLETEVIQRGIATRDLSRISKFDNSLSTNLKRICLRIQFEPKRWLGQALNVR